MNYLVTRLLKQFPQARILAVRSGFPQLQLIQPDRRVVVEDAPWGSDSVLAWVRQVWARQERMVVLARANRGGYLLSNPTLARLADVVLDLHPAGFYFPAKDRFRTGKRLRSWWELPPSSLDPWEMVLG